MRLSAKLQEWSAKRQMRGFFILCALPLGLFMAMTTPPGQVPDEAAHMARAAGLLHGAILATRRQGSAGVMVDSGLFEVAADRTTPTGGHGVETLGDYYALRNLPSAHRRQFAAIPNTGDYFPAAYLPAALGLGLAGAFDARPFASMILARVFMLAAFLALGDLALRTAAYGEALLFCVLLMPGSLFLAGSLNQDGVLIGLACVSAAAMTQDFSAPKTRLLALSPLVLILLAKPPYLPLLGLALLPFDWRRTASRLRDLALAAAPVLIWAALIAAFVAVPFTMPPYHPGPLFVGDHSIVLQQTDARENLHILLARPERLIGLPWQVAQEWGKVLFDQMIGMLGLLNLVFPDRFYHAWTVALAVAVLGLVFAPRREGSGVPNGLLQFLFVPGLLLLTLWTVTLSFYPGWSLVGSATIAGMQGRYLVVLLPFLLAAVPEWGSRWRIPAIAPALPAIALGIYDLGYVPSKIIAFFFMY